MGYTSGGVVAAQAALTHPELFGKSAITSLYLPGDSRDTLIELASKEGSSGAAFLVLWNRYELRREEWNLDLAADSRTLHDALQSNGHPVSGGRTDDSAGWGAWRAQVGTILESFFPAGS
jgi:enterochelin esterase-like enzyme